MSDDARRTPPASSPRRTPDDAPADGADYRCDLCGSPMKEWHCRIICTACGYQRDCSDP